MVEMVESGNPFFEGQFSLDKPLTSPQIAYLRAFSETRHMRRSTEILETAADPIREAVGIPVGPEGAYYVGTPYEFDSPGVIDVSQPPAGQPGLWCLWVPNENGTAIEWNGGDKFLYPEEWLEYLIRHFLEPWGYMVNGRVTCTDEECVASKPATLGFVPCIWRAEIAVVDNVVEVKSTIERLR